MEIKLKRDGWHRKLQEYVFGNPPMYYNFCPYFWLTNFCILITFIIPIVPLVKGLVRLFRGAEGFFESMADFVDANWCQPNFNRKVDAMSNEELLRAWAVRKRKYFSYEAHDDRNWEEYDFWINKVYAGHIPDPYCKGTEKMIKKFDAWRAKNPNWEQVLEDYKKQRIADREAYLKNLEETREKQALHIKKMEERAERAKARRQAMFSWIARNTKWMMYILAAAVFSFVGYWLWQLGVYIVEHFYWDKFLTVLKWIGLGLVIGTVLVLFIYAIVKLVQRIPCNICIADSWFGRGCCWFFGGIGRGFIWIGNKLGSFFSFFWEYACAAKKDYCPGIVWEDKK